MNNPPSRHHCAERRLRSSAGFACARQDRREADCFGQVLEVSRMLKYSAAFPLFDLLHALHNHFSIEIFVLVNATVTSTSPEVCLSAVLLGGRSTRPSPQPDLLHSSRAVEAASPEQDLPWMHACREQAALRLMPWSRATQTRVERRLANLGCGYEPR